MKSKLMFPILSFIFLVIMGTYFLINPSYQKSIEAKYYYEMGEYKEAYTLAKEAFSQNHYNRMASTTMVQSKIALHYVNYINQAKEYFKEIQKIAQEESISDANRAKIKMMSEIVVGSYTKLAPSVVIDSILIQEAKKYHDDFKTLLEKLSDR